MTYQKLFYAYRNMPAGLLQMVRILDALHDGLDWYVDHTVRSGNDHRWEVYASAGLIDINLDWGD